LDEFIGSRNLPQPSYLKIDVDGSEVGLVRGAAKTLHDKKLRSLMFELNTRDSSYSQLVDALDAAGLSIVNRYQVEPDLFNIWFERQNADAR